MFDKILRLSKDTLIYGTSTIIGRFLIFLLVPVYTNVFPPAEYGIVANLYAYIAILNVFFSIGLESGYFKFASTLEEGTVKENFSHPFNGIMINSLFLSSVLFIFSENFCPLFQIDVSKSALIKYSALILFFDNISLVPFAYLRLKNKPKIFASFKFVNIIINLLMNILLIFVFRFGIESIFISNLTASGLTFLLLLPIIKNNFVLSFNKRLVNELLKFSIPYIPAGISSNLLQAINRPILTYLTDDATVGIFQASYKLGIFMMLFVAMFEFAWRPFFLQNAKENNAKEIFSKVMTAFVFVAAIVFLIISLFVDDIARMKMPFRGTLIGSKYWSGLDIVPVILFAYLLYGIYINLMAGIYIEKKTKYLPVITGSAAAVNIFANFMLIPHYGMMGSAMSTLFGYITMTAGIYLVSQRFYRIQYEYLKVFAILLLSSGLYIIYYVSKNYIDFFTYYKILLILIFILSMFLLKIINFGYLKEIISGKNK
ncbi:MAG: hypothetical protein FJ216_04235 [Ignavibacteria bacterium]|nr:hypothetical protein [Ignavibacteria bacterium]